MTTKEMILEELIKHTCIPDSFCGIPLSSYEITRRLNKSRYKVYNILKELRVEGIVEVEQINYYDDWSCKNTIIKGWVLTKEFQKTEKFKKRDIEISKIFDRMCEETFGKNE